MEQLEFGVQLRCRQFRSQKQGMALDPKGDLYIGNVFQQTGTGGGGPTTGMQDNVTLRSANSIAGGVQPLAGRFAVGGGFVNLDFGILAKVLLVGNEFKRKTVGSPATGQAFVLRFYF